MSKKSEYVKKWRHRTFRPFIHEAKNKPCVDCDQSYPFYVMQFDHVRGVKSFNIGRALSSPVSRIRLLEELAKCDVVCANCHAARTYKRLPSSVNGNTLDR